MRAHVTVAKPIGRIAITVPKGTGQPRVGDRKSTRLNSSHGYISYAVFCLKKKTSIHGEISPDVGIHLLNHQAARDGELALLVVAVVVVPHEVSISPQPIS